MRRQAKNVHSAGWMAEWLAPVRGLSNRWRELSSIEIIADQVDATDLPDNRDDFPAHVVSLKLLRDRGLIAMRDVAAVARSAGIGLYGCCLLESSIGAAARLQVFAGLPGLVWVASVSARRS